ncbi:MAG: hypothetical protein ACLUNO_13460 [Oscillospiraceae bacterium]
MVLRRRHEQGRRRPPESEAAAPSLDFPQHYSGTVSATVFSKSEPDSSGEVAVVFACNNALADTLAMRKATADVVYSEHTGLRVPLKAVHMDDDGQTYRLRRHGGAAGEKTDRDHLPDRRATVSSPRARTATLCAPATTSSSAARGCPTDRS